MNQLEIRPKTPRLRSRMLVILMELIEVTKICQILRN